ncbi:MAG TPA: type IV pilus biogenesis/stability protein PilW [Gammaproteobacteria bacterium]
MKTRILAAGFLLPLTMVLAACVSTGPVEDDTSTEAARFNTRLAAEYLKRGDVQTAMQKVDKALEQDDELPEAHLVKGMIYARAEEYGEADDHFLRAADLGETDPAILNNVAAYLCRRGRNEDGEEIFLDVAKMATFARPAIALTNAGMCARRIPEPARAERHLRRALDLEPSYAPALWHMAELSLEQGDHLSARAFLQRMESVQRLGPDALWLGVRIERKLEDEAAATRYADILLRDFPESAEARALLENQQSSTTH